MSKNQAKIFIDNGNISDMNLYQDCLHLLERCKFLLARNIIYVLNNFLNMQKHHPLDKRRYWTVLRKQIY